MSRTGTEEKGESHAWMEAWGGEGAARAPPCLLTVASCLFGSARTWSRVHRQVNLWTSLSYYKTTAFFI